MTANVTGLAPGTYNGAVTITATSATGSPATIPVTLNIAQPPVLAVAPSSLTFTGAGSQSLAISNTGGGTLNWTAAANQAWLTVTPLSGTGAGSVSVTANVTGLAPGTYNGAVTITATSATGSPATIPVTLNIAQPPVLAVAPSSLTFTGAGSQSLAISNTGGGTLNWTAAANQAWLSVSPLSGTGVGSVSVTANVTGLAPGTYNGAVTITATGATGSPATIPVTLNIASSPALAVAPSSLTFTGAGSQTLTISNTGGGTLTWTAERQQPWLTLSQATGTTPEVLTVSPSVFSLAPGTYTDTITISALNTALPKQTVIVTLTVPVPNSPAPGNQWYVAPNGSAGGDGTIASPWNLATALAHPASVRPGDTIWVRGGTYGSGQATYYSRLVGTQAAPIIVRQYPGERAIINGWLQVGCCDGNAQPDLGAYAWFWGLEFASSITDRGVAPDGTAAIYSAIDCWAPGSRFINLIIHDTRQGIAWWKEAVEGDVYGNLIYYNGYQGLDRGHGHGLYAQNHTGLKRIRENIIFDQFGGGMHIYGSTSETYIRNIALEGNIAFNSGSIAAGNPIVEYTDNVLFAGGIGGVQNITLLNNHLYHTPGADSGYNEIGFPWSEVNAGIYARNNYFIGGKETLNIWRWIGVDFQKNVLYSKNLDTLMIIPADTQSASNYSFNLNTYFGSGRFTYNGNVIDFGLWKSRTGVDTQSSSTVGDPAGVWSFVRPNEYEPGRANIVIYNWAWQSSVPVSLSGVLAIGQHYEIRDAQNFFASPVASGIYSGAPVSIPMTGLTAALPNGNIPTAPVHTAPLFGVFVVLPR